MADPVDSPLSAAQRSRIRRLSAPHDPPPGEEAGELNIVPYLDIVMNIIVFVISTLTVVVMSTFDVLPAALPDPGKGKATQDIKTKALSLTAIVTGEGISLKTSQGNLAPGCTGWGQGVTVPRVNGQHDYNELARCARELKKANPDEHQVTITANPDTDFQTVVETLDALRRDKDGELFGDAAFGVAR